MILYYFSTGIRHVSNASSHISETGITLHLYHGRCLSGGHGNSGISVMMNNAIEDDGVYAVSTDCRSIVTSNSIIGLVHTLGLKMFIP